MELERVFEWTVGDVDFKAARWRFDLESAGEQASRLRFSAEMGPAPSGLTPAIERMPDREAEVAEVHDLCVHLGLLRLVMPPLDWWTLTRMGVPAVILHGGNEAWFAAGGAVETGPSQSETGTVTVSPRDGGLADADDVLAALEAGGSCVVDALSRDNYEGRDPGYGPRRGHITGAENVPYLDLIKAETAAFKPVTEIQRLLGDVLDRERVITYCGGAIAATVVAFCLDMCGHDDVRVYDGSLMEWSRRDDLPMTDPSSG
ncbi:MAG: hypothetical protein ISQ15_04865 [Ilumatobacteraceae bacterium]|nr:hypothetical protein [Ilumatobacteraceae bacterium]